jgi:CRP-like cAMP-binding protein
MTATGLIDQLVEHKTVGSAPREELAWLASHGTIRHLAAGDVLSAKGTPVEALFVVLTGHVAIFVDRGAGKHKVMEWRAGGRDGHAPLLAVGQPPGDNVALEPSEILSLHRDHLFELIHNCHQLTTILVHKMLDRARLFTSSALHDEKMASLGKLSAGWRTNSTIPLPQSSALLRFSRTGLRMLSWPHEPWAPQD